MKTILLWIMLIAVAIGAAGTRAQADNADDFIAGIDAYKAGDYRTAIALWEALARKGINNGHLFYNLGNAYLKNDALGHAILWYTRAKRLLPNDPDIQFNANYAREQTVDKAEHNSASLSRILFFWKYQLSPSTILVLAVAFNGLFWGLAVSWRLSRRKVFRTASQLALVPTLIFLLTAGVNAYEARTARHAIVLDNEIAVRSGLEETSTELFILHTGAAVKIMAVRGGFCKIRFSPDKIGWVPKAAVGRI